MVIGPAGTNDPPRHEHLTLETDDGWRVGFVDPRRFGSVDLVATDAEDAHRLLAGLGPEPLDAGIRRGAAVGRTGRAQDCDQGGAARPASGRRAWATST